MATNGSRIDVVRRLSFRPSKHASKHIPWIRSLVRRNVYSWLGGDGLLHDQKTYFIIILISLVMSC